MKFKFLKAVLVCLVIFVHGLVNAAESDATSLEIGPAMGEYQWHDAWQLSNDGNGYVIFQAEGILGMHVAFASDRNDNATMYELIVGEDNSRTYFRNVRGGEALVSVTGDSAKMTSGLASYWLMMDNGILSFGKGEELGVDVILQWEDQNPYANTQWVGFSSWYAPISYRNIEVHSLNELVTLKNPSQSTTLKEEWGAGRAIDGNYETFSHTKNLLQSWWQVELSKVQPIQGIDLYNRELSSTVQGRLRDFYVLVSKIPFDNDMSLTDLIADTDNVTSEFIAGPVGDSHRINFNGVLGKYVRVQHRDLQNMALAEVVVNPERNIIYGTKEDDIVSGFVNDDILFGHGGDDVLRGKSGSDIYHWGSGGGNDVIDEDYGVNLSNESLENDILIFGEGITKSHLSWKQSGDDLVFTLKDTWETITILNQFLEGYNKIETVELFDGTALDLTQITNDVLTSNAIDITNENGLHKWNNSWRLPEIGNGSVVFQAQSIDNIHVAFADDQSDSANAYRLIIGEGNTGTGDIESSIEKWEGTANVVVSETVTESVSDFAYYWVKLENGIISYGTGDIPGVNEKLSYSDGTPLTGIEWIGFSSDVNIVQFKNIEVKSLYKQLTLTNAVQSSLYPHNSGTGGALLAIDGNTNGDYYSFSVTATESEYRPWWQAELDEVKLIHNIQVYNRTDKFPERLGNFYVFLSRMPFENRTLDELLADTENVYYRHFPDQGDEEVKGFDFTDSSNFNGIKAKYVRVQLVDTDIFSLAEVEVFGITDIITGTTGTDTLIGTNGNDVLIGLAGDDTLKGKAGDDTYHWGNGDGNDTIDNAYGSDPSNTTDIDTLIFGEGIALGNLFWRQSGNDLVFTLSYQDETVTISSYFFEDAYKVEVFKLADGTVLELSDIQPTPIHSYSFSGNANDEIGDAHGTVSDATLTTDRFGNTKSAYLFDGIDGNSAIVANFTSPATATFTMWATWDGVLREMLFNTGANGSGPDLYFSHRSAIDWNFWDGSNEFGDIADANVSDNLFHHYAVVNDAVQNITSLYIDGEFFGTATYNYNSNTPFTIGNGSTGGEYGWGGKIDEVKVYDKALTQAQIQAVMQSYVTPDIILVNMQTENEEQVAAVRMRKTTPISVEIMIEERSYSNPTPSHADEDVGYFKFNQDTFDEYGIQAETGKFNITLTGSEDWTEVPLAKDYTNPIVFMQLITQEGTTDVHIRIKDVQVDDADDSTVENFSFRVEEWVGATIGDATETVNYLVIEGGEHDLEGGNKLVAGIASDITHDYADVSWGSSFTEMPVVLSQSQTYAGVHYIVTRHKEVSTTGFKLRVQEPVDDADGHAGEKVGYIAIGIGVNSYYEVNKASGYNENWKKLSFEP